jgi:predicted Rdx family selenoprotein
MTPPWVPPSAARFKERGAALLRWERDRGDFERLAQLDQRVRDARRTDWPGRPPGPERRNNG